MAGADTAARKSWWVLWLQVDGNRAEFWSYSILHAASLGTGQLSQELCQLPRDVMDDPLVTHALATVNAYRYGSTV